MKKKVRKESSDRGWNAFNQLITQRNSDRFCVSSLQTVFSLFGDQAFCLLPCSLAKNINIQRDIHQRRRTKRPVSTNRPQCTAASPSTCKTSAVVRDNPALNIWTRQSSFCFWNDTDIRRRPQRCILGDVSGNENRRTGSRFTKREASLQQRPFISLYLNVVNLLQLRFSLQINWFRSIRCFGPPSYTTVTFPPVFLCRGNCRTWLTSSLGS